MMDEAQQLLRDTFGFEDFRSLQREAVGAALAARDALVLMPTGGGKSLCYQIPALLREGTGVVVSPLIALMQDQVAALLQLGIRAAYLNSSQLPAEQHRVIDALRDGQLDLLYVAPERLLMDETLQLLSGQPLALFAIDEAHCVSQWGHDFRPDYLGLSQLAEQFPGVPRIALTATADARTREEIVARLKLTDPAVFVDSFDRPNIRYSVATKTNGRRQLAGFLQSHEGDAGIIYCRSRAGVDRLAAQLQQDGYDALPYHAGQDAETRRRNQARFLREDGVIVVATIAFGMGIDKPDVRFVAHMDLPKSVEAYYQETGRAGRDGAPADAWMVFGMQDVVRLRQMVDQSDADEQHKRIERQKLDLLLGWAEITTCRRQALLAYFGETSVSACGNCDICDSPPETYDATEPARQFLSCVYRTGQRFGAAHIIDVLLGNRTDKTVQHQHDALSTWGIGAALSDKEWRSIARQLTVRGYLWADADRFGALRLAAESRPLLRGEETLVLRKDPASRTRVRKRASSVTIAEEDEPLWQALKNCRKRISDEEGVPPYVVFHDATLLAMVEHRPMSPQDLLPLHGVGEKRLERYGEAFLTVIQEHELRAVEEG